MLRESIFERNISGLTLGAAFLVPCLVTVGCVMQDVGKRGEISLQGVNGTDVPFDAKVPGANSEVALAEEIGVGFRYFCSGSIVGKRWILTAQHCVDGYNKKTLFIIFADDVTKVSSRFDDDHPLSRKMASRSVNKIYLAPGYTRLVDAKHEWLADEGKYQIRLQGDAALVQLNQDIPDGFTPALISDDRELSAGEVLDFVGYGSFNGQVEGGGKRRTTQLRSNGNFFDGGTVDNIPARVYQLEKTHSDQNRCQGDSGGGAFSQRGGQIFIVGLNSYTKGSIKPGYEYDDCAAGLAHVFYVPDLKPWIRGVVGAEIR